MTFSLARGHGAVARPHACYSLAVRASRLISCPALYGGLSCRELPGDTEFSPAKQALLILWQIRSVGML